MERPITDVASMVNGILTFVRFEAQGMEIGEVERRLLSMAMAVGRAALEEFVAAKGTGHLGKETIDALGNRCPYVRDRTCAYRSVFGTIPIPRAYYHATGSPGIFPLDGELNLPERGYSYVVQEFSYQFNRRSWDSQLFNRTVTACLTTSTVTFAELRV